MTDITTVVSNLLHDLVVEGRTYKLTVTSLFPPKLTTLGSKKEVTVHWTDMWSRTVNMLFMSNTVFFNCHKVIDDSKASAEWSDHLKDRSLNNSWGNQRIYSAASISVYSWCWHQINLCYLRRHTFFCASCIFLSEIELSQCFHASTQ